MARRRPPTVHGVCIVDKPAGVTSHDVVGMLRRRFSERRIGHAGTLDPGATGVLVIGVGHATRLLAYTGDVKTYTAEVVFGSETDTLDADGTVTAHHEMAPIDIDQVRHVVATSLTGTVMQVPPMVSARRVDGRRLHDIAREGREVEREARPITVRRFDVEPTTDPYVVAISVDCSTGTYVRTLAADLGALMGGGAHLRKLRRTAVGTFGESRAGHPDTCELHDISTAVEGLQRWEVDDATAGRVRNGAVLEAPLGDGPWAVVCAGELLAVYEAHTAGRVKPSVVLPRD